MSQLYPTGNPAAASDAPLTVGQLTRKLKNQLEHAFPFVWVRGQVSNLSRPSSGHIYFALKDHEALVPAVWFRGSQRQEETFDPLTGEVYEDGPRPGLAANLANGQEVVVAGRLTVYPPRGAYQIIVDLVQDAGLGRLHQEFERIKAALAAEGLFSQERKRPLPSFPARVGVITAPSGAAIRDFCRLAGERGGFAAEIRIYPAPVQGEGAPEKIAAAISLACASGWAEVICLIRGGGSLEDLWAFNTEAVARAIHASGVPVLAGIGHEVDVSIADLVADLRAATPSHAAQLLWREKRELIQQVDETEIRLNTAFAANLERRQERLARLAANLHLLSPQRLLLRRAEQVSGAAHRLDRAMSACLRPRELSLNGTAVRLDLAIRHPLRLKEAQVDRLETRLAACNPARRLHERQARLANWEQRLNQSAASVLERAQRHLAVESARLGRAAQAGLNRIDRNLERLDIRLRGLDPHLPLERGYAMVRQADGTLLRSVEQTAPGAALTLQIRDGSIAATVANTQKTSSNADRGKEIS